MMFNVPVAVSGGGYAVPAAFLVATVALTIFATGYIEMARRVPSVGGFYAFISRGLGQVMGMGAGLLIAFCYVIFAAAVTGVGSYFASTSIETWTGVAVPAWGYMILFLALMTGFAWFHIELTAKILGVALISEVLALLVLCGGIVVAGGGPDGFSAAPLNPANIFDNDAALKVFGAAAAGVALFGAFWSWVGFEMAPNYAEESREPTRIAKAATYGSVIGLGLFYVLVSYMFVTGWGLTGSAQAVADQFAGKLDSAFYPLTDKYVGGGLTTILEVLIITSSFACAMAFYNTGARYLFSLAREGVLPAGLGRVHPTQRGPVNASMTVSVLAGLYMLAFVLSDSSTLAALLKLGTWTPLLGVLGILAVQGHLLRCHRALLPDRGARRLPPDQDAARAGHRLPRHGRRVLPADRLPRGPLRRRRGALHQARPVRGAGDLRRRHGRRAVATPTGRPCCTRSSLWAPRRSAPPRRS